jgi:hypothetical protein
MAKLIGAQRMVLQAILDASGDMPSFVEDSQIARTTRIALQDVRDWLETLEGDEYVEIARTEAGLSASITAKGRLALGQYQPFPSPPPGPGTSSPPTSATPAAPAATSFVPSPAESEPSSKRSNADQKASQPFRVFYSYSHKDEALRDELEEHLSLLKRQGFIAGWHDRRIGAGEEWKGQLDRNLEEAEIILLLVSPSFLASDYCYDVETKRALERHERGEARVIPIILRPVDWKGVPFEKLQALPIDLRPVTTWSNRDEAFKDIAEGIRRVVEKINRSSR